MEFLDDLLNPTDPEEESDTQSAGKPSGPAEDTAQQSDRQTQLLPAQDDDAWNSLLEGVTYDDLEEVAESPESKTARKHRPHGRKLSNAQKAMLGVLGVLVVGVWVVIIMLVSQSFSGGNTDATGSLVDAEVTAIPNTDLTPGSPDVDQERPANDETTADVSNTPTPAPTQPPTATPPIFTALDRQIQDDPDNTELYLQRAETYITLGAYQAALTDLAAAKELDETRAGIYIIEGWAGFYTGHWQNAEEAFGTAIDLDEDLPEAHFGLGQVLFHQGRYKEAASEFDWAAEINPQNAEAEAWLAISAAKLKDKEEAYGAAGRAISQTNTLPIVYVAQSWARRTESPPNIDGAQADLLYAQDLKSNDFTTLNALAEFYVDHRPERLAEAELLASYAYNWATNDVERAIALQTLGRVYLQQDRKGDAERAFREAIDFTSRDGEILLFGLTEDLATARE